MKSRQDKKLKSLRKQKNSCKNKKKYNTHQQAQSRCCNLWDKGIKLKVYTCNICEGFHVCKISVQDSLDYAFRMISKEKK